MSYPTVAPLTDQTETEQPLGYGNPALDEAQASPNIKLHVFSDIDVWDNAVPSHFVTTNSDGFMMERTSSISDSGVVESVDEEVVKDSIVGIGEESNAWLTGYIPAEGMMPGSATSKNPADAV